MKIYQFLFFQLINNSSYNIVMDSFVIILFFSSFFS